MAKHSAGLLMYRCRDGVLEVFLVHPGGPFWAEKDLGAWSLPKGEYGPDETPVDGGPARVRRGNRLSGRGRPAAVDPPAAAQRQDHRGLGLPGGLRRRASRSNTFSLEWPPRSGRRQDFPEVDRAGWFALEEAKAKINQGQVGFLEELQQILLREKQRTIGSKIRNIMKPKIQKNNPHRILMGNEAMGRGLVEAGVTLAASYPGTPASEILLAVVAVAKETGAAIHAEWSVNEKVAYETALANSMAGRRSAVAMKQVGLNVASDPFMRSAYLGVKGGLIVISADDPGPHSSQTEQDSRFFAMFAKYPGPGPRPAPGRPRRW